ncbi:MAG: RNA polymerase sigma factor [Acidimicrobiales bacterium]
MIRPSPSGEVDGLATDVDAARAGSVPAFERIYHELAPSVASYLRWNGASDVESLTNEVMAQVHRNLDRFTGDAGAFRSWVFTIAHHRMVDDRRAAGRRPIIADAEVTEGTTTGDAEQDALASLSDVHMRRLIEGLSPDQRDVLLLRIVADLSLEDTAVTLRKQRGAVKSLQHRALASLRRQLEREVLEQ